MYCQMMNSSKSKNTDKQHRLIYNQFIDFSPKQFGHFTQLIWHNAYTIGCAASKFLYDYNGLKNAVMLTCNYALGNHPHEMIYEPGPTASECEAGTNPKYPGLCSEDEKWKHFYLDN